MNLTTNWKTTGAGIGAILVAAGNLLTHASSGDFSTLGTDGAIIIAGLIGIFAKDSNVTGGNVRQ